jgi:Glycosyl hydrolases family 38 N-terminal domain
MENIESGLRFLSANFNSRPHVAWQLDPFGYSAYTPTLYSLYGFDSLFITRVGTSVKDKLREQGHLRFIWRGHDNQDIFVTVCQGELYTVTYSLRYDVLTPVTSEDSCSLQDMLDEKLECLDYFVFDIV